eukprot:TRINITY_DN2788_c0_g1_i3.p1 TRINITY_DN2788_c0_g1~~TRINITY_DN2788_c0_g1_i3.p1  ORF type:complete len:310 (-),score=36.75 TRINITY_DN2788_c0_g1_i3:485-1414(-)
MPRLARLAGIEIPQEEPAISSCYATLLGSSQSTASGSSTFLRSLAAAKRTSRTALSSTAKPFQSLAPAAGCSSLVDSAWPDMWPGVPYIEEQACLKFSKSPPTDDLPEQAYLGAARSPGNEHQRHSFHGLRADSSDCAGRPLRMPSRTPSPVQRQEMQQLEPALWWAAPADNFSTDPETEQWLSVGSSFMPSRAEAEPKEMGQNQVASCSTSPFPSWTIKNTFLHYCFDDEATGQQVSLKRCSSAPGALDASPGSRHDLTACRPCAYFYGKEDGCRQGDTCPFCHLCPPGMIKEKKKQKMQRLKALRRR